MEKRRRMDAAEKGDPRSGPEASSSSSSSHASLMNNRKGIPTWQKIEAAFWTCWASGLIIYIFYCGYQSGNERLANGEFNFQGLVPGWFMGRKIDLSDTQYVAFRSYLPTLFAGMLVYLSLSYWVKTTYEGTRPRMVFYLCTSICFLIYLHRLQFIWVVLAALANYSIGQMFGTSYWTPVMSWIFNIFIRIVSEKCEGFYFGKILGPSFSWMDGEGYRGILAWQVYYNLAFLRFVSFNMDYYWTLRQKEGKNIDNSDKQKPQREETAEKRTPRIKSDYETRRDTMLPLHEYTLSNYLAYVFYVPLYIAGPIINFPAFISQIRVPQKSHSFGRAVRMMLSVLGYLLVLDISLHFFYHYGVSKYELWRNASYPSWELALTGFWTLNFMYTKFLCIWRFFRVWSIFEGVDTPENMNRCVNNNYTFAGFWRAWHASLNEWILRYMYFPLGGRKTQLWNMWIIFTFIGLWHDLWLTWLAWAWINCVCFSLEIIIIGFFYKWKPLAKARASYGWRYAIATGACFNMYALMAANLAILYGFEGTWSFFHAYWSRASLAALVVPYTFFWTLNNSQQYIRESEEKSGAAKRF